MTAILGFGLFTFRTLFLLVVVLGSSVMVLLVSLFAPFDPRGSDIFFQYIAPWALRCVGIRFIIRNRAQMATSQPCIFVGNHQSILDLFVAGAVLPPRTVVVGKKSLAWIPLFGWAFYVSGQLLLDRKNRKKAIAGLEKLHRRVLKKRLSVLIFPEGTRSRTTGLGPFKKGAFHLALATGYPVQPFVVSSFYGGLDLRKWNAGTLRAEVLEPVRIPTDKDALEVTMLQLHAVMEAVWKRLDAPEPAD